MKRFLQTNKRLLLSAAFVFLCFLLNSAGYLAWLYRLLAVAPEGTAELFSTGLGYGMQAAGIGMFAFVAHKRPSAVSAGPFFGLLACFTAAAYAAAAVSGFGAVLALGILSNLLCGGMAGFYLYVLTESVPANRRAIAFGAAYALAAVVSRLLSLPGNGFLFNAPGFGFLAALLSLTLVLLVLFARPFAAPEEALPVPETETKSPGAGLLIAAGAAMLLFSAVNHIGFAFPAADLANGVDLETTRLCYAAGLLIAGFVNDKSRPHGAVLTLAALVIPFTVLALRGQPIPAMIPWSLSYFAAGFFSVYRVTLFTDLAQQRRQPFLSGCGLLFGRLGEALGTLICFFTAGRTAFSAAIAAAVYVGTLFLFFRLYYKLYLPEADREKQEKARFVRFSTQHDLSPREREILTLLLEQATTADIAEQLFVSESTVKFHVHNLLQKTGCKSRKELAERYRSAR